MQEIMQPYLCLAISVFFCLPLCLSICLFISLSFCPLEYLHWIDNQNKFPKRYPIFGKILKGAF
jgi:hypothetical protein